MWCGVWVCVCVCVCVCVRACVRARGGVCVCICVRGGGGECERGDVRRDVYRTRCQYKIAFVQLTRNYLKLNLHSPCGFVQI